MNKKIYIALIDWIRYKEAKDNFIPFKQSKFGPQISVEGEYVVNGSSWSVFLF